MVEEITSDPIVTIASMTGTKPTNMSPLSRTRDEDMRIGEAAVCLSPIRFFIDNSVAANYDHHIELPKEIQRCFPHAKLNIKFAYIKGRKVTIITNDESTHKILSSTWPAEAFSKGTTPCLGKEKRIFKVSLLGLPKTLKIDSVNSILKEQGISKSTRQNSRFENQPTSIVNAEVTGTEKYRDLLENGFNLGIWSKRFKVVPKFRLKQCFNCFKTGHLSFNCKNEKKCINCGQNHEGTCTNLTKCSNCHDTHSAVSRKCNYLKEAERALKQSTKPNSKGPVLVNSPHPAQNFWSRKQEEPQEDSPIDNDKISKQIEEKINLIINTHLGKIETVISNRLEELMNSLIGPIVDRVCNALTVQLSGPIGSTNHHHSHSTSQIPTIITSSKQASKDDITNTMKRKTDESERRVSMETKSTKKTKNKNV